jgi:branched-chain amino acid aminotransferase
MNNDRKVWWNGKLIPENEAKISIYDSALMFGDTVFEMTRSFNKKQFKLKEHLERLYASIKYVRIPIKMTTDEMEKAIYETIEANDPLFADDDEHRIMINVTRGLLSIYQDVVGISKGINVIIADFPLRWTVVGMGKLFDIGINAIITSQRAIPASLLEPKVKNRSRLHYLMANIETSNHKGDNNWALLLDPDGFVAEGTGDNFFIVKDGVIITPEPRNILRGVSREYIFKLADQLGSNCIEKNIEPYDVMFSDEAFMTGTPFCMLPVTSLNGTKINNGKVGSVFKLLLKTWGNNVGLNIENQIKKWDTERNETDVGVSPYSFGGNDNVI